MDEHLDVALRAARAACEAAIRDVDRLTWERDKLREECDRLREERNEAIGDREEARAVARELLPCTGYGRTYLPLYPWLKKEKEE